MIAKVSVGRGPAPRGTLDIPRDKGLSKNERVGVSARYNTCLKLHRRESDISTKS